MYYFARRGMKKKILILASLVLLNGCAEYTAMIGPSITMATTGNVAKAGASLAASTTIDQSELIDENTKIRECRTLHSAELNEIFFTTLDEFDCVRNDFSILR